MSEFDAPTLSAHEIVRFSRDQARMRVHNVSFYNHRVVISLHECPPRQDAWELADIGSRVHLTRFPATHPVSFDGRLGSRSEGTVTRELFARIVAIHRPAIVSMVRGLIVAAVEARARAVGRGEEEAADDRLEEMRRVIRCLLPEDFPE